MKVRNILSSAVLLSSLTACNGSGVSVSFPAPAAQPGTVTVTQPTTASNPAPAPQPAPAPAPEKPPVIVVVAPPKPAPQPVPPPAAPTLNDILKSLASTAHFGTLISSNSATAPKKAASLKDTHYLACAGATHALYLDLSHSDLGQGNFKAIGSWVMPAKKTSGTDPRSRLSNKLLANQTSVEGGTSIDLKTLDADSSDETVKLSFHSFSTGESIIQASESGEWADDRFSENMICDGYVTSYFAPQTKNENLFYQCDGLGEPYFEFFRAGQLSDLIGYDRQMDMVSQVTSSDPNYWSTDKWLIETDSKGQSISNAEGANIGGVSQIDDKVIWKNPYESAMDYTRIFKTDWTQISAANPPASFSVTAIENAPMGEDQNFNPLPEPTSNHTCTRVQ